MKRIFCIVSIFMVFLTCSVLGSVFLFYNSSGLSAVDFKNGITQQTTSTPQHTLTYNANGGTSQLASTNIGFRDCYGKKNVYDPSKCQPSGLSLSGNIFTINYTTSVDSPGWVFFSQPYTGTYNTNTKFTVVLECLSHTSGVFNFVLTSPDDIQGETDIGSSLSVIWEVGSVGVYTTSFTTKSTYQTTKKLWDFRSYCAIGANSTVKATFRISLFIGDVIFNNFSYAPYESLPSGNLLPTATRPNYTFDGWYTASSGGTKIFPSTVYTHNGNLTVYAHWIPIAITVNVRLRVINKNGEYSNVDNSNGGVVYVSGYKVSGNSSTYFNVPMEEASLTLSIHQAQKFGISVNSENSGYVFAGFSTSGDLSASQNYEIRKFAYKRANGAIPPAKAVAYYPTASTTYYVFFKQISDNLLKYDDKDKYFYFEDGYYPQSDVNFELEKMSFNESNGNATAVCENGVLKLNGSGGFGALYSWNRTFKLGERFKVDVKLLSGSVSDTMGYSFCFEINKEDGQSISSRNHVDTIVRNVEYTDYLTVNSAGANEGGKLVFWIWSGGDVVFDNAVIQISVRYMFEDFLSSAQTNGETICYNNGTDDVALPVYTYNGNRYAKVTARGETKWFKFEPIRWRISDYGVEKSERNLARYTTLLEFKYYTSFSDNFVAVSDLILGVGAMHNTRKIDENLIDEEGKLSGTYARELLGYQKVKSTTDSITLNFNYSNTSSLIDIERYGCTAIGNGNAVYNSVDDFGWHETYNAPLRIVSIKELQTVGLVNRGARASDMVAFILGQEKNQVSYWTRDLSNLGAGVAISPTGTEVRNWLDEMLGVRFAYNSQEGTSLFANK